MAGRAEGVEGEVGAAAGQLTDRGRGVRRAGRVHALRRAELPRQVQGPRRHVDGDDPRARGRRDHHRRQADPAAAVHRDPLPRRDPALLHHRPERRGEPAAERGRRGEGQLLRDRHEVHVGVVQCHVLGEGAPVGEAGLGLPLAHLLVARRAGRAGAAGADEGHGHPVAGPPARSPGRPPPRRPRRVRARARAAARCPGRGPASRASRCGTGPVASTRTTTPCSAGSGSGTSRTSAGSPYRSNTTARMAPPAFRSCRARPRRRTEALPAPRAATPRGTLGRGNAADPGAALRRTS